MATRTGSIGSNSSSGNETTFKSAKSLGITLNAGEYPHGTVKFTNIKASDVGRWVNRHNSMNLNIKLYLCDSSGGNKVKIGDWTISANSTNTTNSFNIPSGATGLAGKKLYLIMDNTQSGSGWDSRDYTILRNKTSVSVQTAYNQFSVTAASNGNGTLTASANPAIVGSTVTLTPTPATGYEFSSYTKSPASLAITNNKFTMPAQAVTVTATFAKKNFTITAATNPDGAGTISVNSTAQMGDTVSVSQTEASGYYFNGWTTSPELTIENGQFTMPAANVTITANYLKRSTATISTTSIIGGAAVNVVISADSSAFTHKIKLSFGTGMETNWLDVSAGVANVTISVPE